MLGNIAKGLDETFKHMKENDKLAKAIQKEVANAKLPGNVGKNIEKILKAQASAMSGMAKSMESAGKAAKDAVSTMGKSDDLALLKELEKAIAHQNEIVKKLIKNASK